MVGSCSVCSLSRAAISSGGNLASGAVLRPNINPGVEIVNPNWRQNPYVNGAFLNPAAFSVAGSLDNPEFGKAPRTMSSVRNPVTQFFDASISKRFFILPNERLSATFEE